jgi:hypothetical protein
MNVTCPSCSHVMTFDQPNRFHAGFANQGFLYSDSGRLTLVWSSFDPAWEAPCGYATSVDA